MDFKYVEYGVFKLPTFTAIEQVRTKFEPELNLNEQVQEVRFRFRFRFASSSMVQVQVQSEGVLNRTEPNRGITRREDPGIHLHNGRFIDLGTFPEERVKGLFHALAQNADS